MSRMKNNHFEVFTDFTISDYACIVTMIVKFNNTGNIQGVKTK